MKIGIDASRAIKKNKTGVEWYAYHVINELIKIDNDNQYILYCQAEPDKWLKKIGERDNVEIKKLRWTFKFFWTQGRLSFEMLLQKFYGIFVTGRHGIPAYAGMTEKKGMTEKAEMAKKTKVKKNKLDILFVPASAMPFVHPKNTITTIHDVGFMKFPKAYGKWQRLYLKWSTKFAVKNAKKIITISEFSKNEIIKYFQADENKIFVTHLGYDERRFNTVETLHATSLCGVLTKYKITKPYILYVGRLETKKNILNIVKAFSAFNNNDYQLVLAGSVGYGFDETRDFIKKNKLADKVVITGYVSAEDLPVLYKNAKLFLFPSLYEGFGLPVLEAFACGVPVICSNTTALAEIGVGAAALVSPHDYKKIAEKMTEILTNERLSDDFAYKGLQKSNDFSWKKCSEKILKVLLAN